MKKLLLGLGSITAVVAPVAAVVSCGDDDKTNAQGQLDQIIGGAGTGVTASLDGTTKVSASVMLTTLPTNLSDATVDLIVNKIKTIGDVSHVTTIEVIATKIAITRATTGTTTQKKYTITVAAGKAGDAAAVKTAAKKASAAAQAYNPADGVNTGAGDNSGSTDGGNAAVTTTDLTATAHVGAAWHSVFRTGSSTPALPEAHHVFTVTVNSLKLTYTWTAADNTALAGFIATTQTKTQDEVVNYLATKLAGTDASVSADQVKTAFGITSANNSMHTFTDTATPAAAATGQATVTLTLDGTQTQAALLAAIKKATGFGTATTKAIVTVGVQKLNIAFKANADDTTIASSITTVLTGNTAFAGCFEVPASA